MRFEFHSTRLVLAIAGVGLSCGGATGQEPVKVEVSPEREGPSFFEEGPSTARVSPASPDLSILDTESVSGNMGPVSPEQIQAEDACIITRAEATLAREAVDIVLLLDNSGSMSDELEAAEQNINLNFAAVLSESQVDYRMILISRHRREPRASSGESSTSVCVSSPLSNLQDCQSASDPVFGERFFHYSTKVESDDSFDILLDTYEPPFDSDHLDRGDNAPQGWSEWLRPGAKKVFLEMTDDNEDMSALAFLEALTEMAPEHFGPNAEEVSFVFHSIVGLAEKVDPSAAYNAQEPLQSERCEGADNDVDNAGEVYQQLSILTNGLRFPLCQFDAYDVVFRQIAEDVVFQTALACDFPIPDAPDGALLDLDKVAISYAVPGEESSRLLGQAPDFASCGAESFLISDGRLTLCPQACQSLRELAEVEMDVLFTCENQVSAPR